MQTFATPALQMKERLDANYYRPEYRDNAEKLHRAGVMSFRNIYTRTGIGHTASVEPHYDLSGNGVPFVAGKAIKNGNLNLEKTERIMVSSHVGAMRKSRLCPGCLLVVRKGDVGDSCVLPIEAGEVNCSSEIMFFQFQPTSESHFLSAFFRSSIGRLATERLRRGSIIPGVSLYDIPDLGVFWPDTAVRQYIGDKVRQAEKLRAFEAMLEQQIASLFQLVEWQGHRVGSQKTYRSAVADMTTERLDAPHYDPAHLHLGKILKDQNALPLSSVCIGVDERWHRREREFFYLEIGEIDLAAGRVSARRLPTNEAPSRAQRLVKPWDVVVATVRPNRKNVAIVGGVSEDLPIVASTGFSVLRFQSEEAAAFYHTWLRSDAATQQLIQWSAGGAYPAIEEDIPLRILVPPFPDDVVSGTGRKCKTKLVAGDLAGKLCDSAKLLVEALIEGRIVEGELKDAQQALDRGDTGLDRAILSRLTEHGIDCPGKPPVFSDLDVLYAAIEDSQCTVRGDGEAK